MKRKKEEAKEMKRKKEEAEEMKRKQMRRQKERSRKDSWPNGRLRR